MKTFLMASLMAMIASCSTLAPTGGTPAALNKAKSNSNNTIIFGRLFDLNPKSQKEKLHLTYTLSKDKNTGMFGADSYPNVDPETGFFWISVPSTDLQYFGVSSIRFKIDGVETPAIMRDELQHKPLMGLPIKAEGEQKFIYVGDLVIRTGLRRTSAGLQPEQFDIKEATNKSNVPAARKYLEDKGFDSKKMVVLPINPRNL